MKSKAAVQPTAATMARFLGIPFVFWLVGVIVVIMVAGAVYAVVSSRQQPPSFPATPPGVVQLWASQTTDMIQGNQISSIALYKSSGPPSQALNYYRKAIPHAGMIGQFKATITEGTAQALPAGLQHLPSVFVDGKGDSARANYTFTEYTIPGSDVAVAIDLRHPKGPTLIFVEMLSA